MTEPNYKEIAENLYKILKEEGGFIPESYKKLLEPKMKLYKVSLTTEFMVYAESVGDAETIARRNLSSETPELGYVYEIEKESELDEWKGCIPYGEENERTCEVILND